MICKRCGCTPERPCLGGCAWMLPDLCTACLTADELAIDQQFAGMVEDLRGELEQSRFERFLLAVAQGMSANPSIIIGLADWKADRFVMKAFELALGLSEASEPGDDSPDAVDPGGQHEQ